MQWAAYEGPLSLSRLEIDRQTNVQPDPERSQQGGRGGESARKSSCQNLGNRHFFFPSPFSSVWACQRIDWTVRERKRKDTLHSSSSIAASNWNSHTGQEGGVTTNGVQRPNTKKSRLVSSPCTQHCSKREAWVESPRPFLAKVG